MLKPKNDKHYILSTTNSHGHKNDIHALYRDGEWFTKRYYENVGEGSELGWEWKQLNLTGTTINDIQEDRIYDSEDSDENS